MLVGRDQALQSLQDALGVVKSGKPVVVFVTGPSGIGKSTLAKRFLETTRAEDDGVVVLSGRCYERESVPYKALDSLVDSLSQYLRRLSPLEIEAVLPRDVLALARLFPVLRRVEAVAGAKRRVLHIPDSQELRRRAFAALRELLGRLSDRSTPILFIDDLQWGDADSAALLAELLRPPEPPALLFIGALRDEARTSGLRASLQFPLAMGEAPDVREIALDPLSTDDAETLAAVLLGDPRPESRELARSIAKATRGNPYFIDELVRTGQASSGGEEEALHAPEEATLEGLIRARAARLPDEARRLLEVVAVAGGPIDRHVAKTAASLDGEGAQALALLQTARLVRPRASRQRDEIETVHDQVRQSIVASLDAAALATLHTRLAIALEASGRADPESLAEHWLLGGDVERASEFVTKAAEQAVEALAFDRAARLFRRALDGHLLTGDEARRLQIALGDALANGGRGFEAAEVYLAAAEGAKAAEALELKRRAAEQLLRSGHIDSGLAALRSVLSAVGLKLADSPRRALVSLLSTRAFLALRGLKYVERDATEIAASQLMKIDICWSVAVGLGIVDTLRGSDFQARHLLLALRSGEPYRVARALAVEVGYSATAGSRAAARTARLIETTAALARRVAPPHALGLATFTAGLAAYLEGRWRRAHDLCEESEAIFREKCTNVAWELGNAHFYSLRSLFHLGQIDEITRRLPKILKDVKERGDLYTETNLRTRVAYVPYLAADDAVAARGEVRAIVDRWSHQGFHLQHYFDLFGQAEIDLYAGDGASAWKRVSRTWPALKHSLFQRIELIFIESHHLHGRAALGAACVNAKNTETASLLALADADAKLIETRAGAAWGRPFAALLTAGAASLRGETRRAVDALLSAESGFEADEMALAAAVARWCRGRLVSGAEGKALVDEAEAWMKRQRIQRPDRMAMMMAPGRWELI